jgi:hypothetical protein
MEQYQIVIVCYAVHCAEALVHTDIIKTSNTDEHQEWHISFFIMWAMLYGFLAGYISWTFIPTAIAARLFTHQVILNYLRNLPITHLGRGIVDRPFKWMEEKVRYSSVVVKVLLLLSTIFI